MKSNHIKTTWVDNKTPVNAANLNKLENAVSELFKRAIDIYDISDGEGISVNTTERGGIEISTNGLIFSESIYNISIDQELPEDGTTDERGRLRLLLGEDLNLKGIYYGGISILDSSLLVSLDEVNKIKNDLEERILALESTVASLESKLTEE